MARRKSPRSGSARRKSGHNRRPGEGAGFLWVVGAVFLAMFYIYWQNSGVVNKTEALEKKIAPTLQKFQIKERDLSGQVVESRKVENRRYIHKEKTYKAPKDLSFNKFETKLKKDLDKSEFSIADAGRAVTKDGETYHAAINYKKYNVMDLRVVKPKTPSLPVAAEERRYKKPRIAIVLDDFGYTMHNFNILKEIKEPITLSVLPSLRYSGEISLKARANGYEVILHLPLESERTDVREEEDTIRTGMSSGQISARLRRELETVPGAGGVSNHMGSKSTAESDTMASIFEYLKKKDLYFFDSMTSPRSVCREVADEVGIKYARRDVFLDNSDKFEDIEARFTELKKIAFKRGYAIAIGHDRKNTVTALRRMVPKLKEEGIEVVPLSEIVK